MMETNEISHHLVRIYRAMTHGEWMTSKQIAATAKVAERTARHHAKNLVTLGVLDLAEVFPAHRYRLAAKASKRNAAFVNRLKAASEVFE